MIENIGFIILRHVNNELTNKYWIHCSDLNKTSLKNINKKNIETLLSSFQNRTQRDLHNISRLLHRSKASHAKLESYGLNGKSVNSIIRIDKTHSLEK